MWTVEEFISDIGPIARDAKAKPDEVKIHRVEVFDQMTVHTRGLKPTTLIETQRPNEPHEIKDYRIANFRPITQQGILKAVDRLYRTMDQSNYSIKVSGSIRDYILGNEFTFYDESGPDESMEFMPLMLNHVLQTMIEDPNGYLFWIPVSPDGIGLPSEYTGTEPIEVEPYYINCRKIIESNSDYVAFFSNEKVAVKQDKMTYYEPIIWVVTMTEIKRFVPVEKVQGNYFRYDEQLYYSLVGLDAERVFFEMLPIIELGGILTSINVDGTDEYYYNSFLQAYNALANEAINAFSDDQAVRVQNAHPIKSVKGDPCTACNGVGHTFDDHGQKHTCGTCNGLGVIPAISPFKVYVKKPGSMGTTEAYENSAAVEFYTPNVAILEHTSKTWKELLRMAEMAVNVAFIDQAQSGAAKEIDRDQLYDLQLKVSMRLFQIIKKSLDIIEAYRVPFVADRVGNYVKSPTQFKNKSQTELIAELTDLKTKGAPSAFILETSKDLARKLYGDDPVKNKMFEILSSYDILFAFTPQEVGIMKAQGLPPDVITKHQYAYAKLQEIAGEDEDAFLDADMPTLIERLDALIAPLIPTGNDFVDTTLARLNGL